jgi:hypothetical protein
LDVRRVIQPVFHRLPLIRQPQISSFHRTSWIATCHSLNQQINYAGLLQINEQTNVSGLSCGDARYTRYTSTQEIMQAKFGMG